MLLYVTKILGMERKKILSIEVKKVKQEYRFLKYAIWKEKTTFTTAAHDSLIKDNIKKY